MARKESEKAAPATADLTEQGRRDQEVIRANRELAAYFRGVRTEREARAALKIIKAFIRDRERIDPSKRRPLPGVKVTAQTAGKPKKDASRKRPRRPTAVQNAKTFEEPPVTTE
jgi:hypothetical protein